VLKYKTYSYILVSSSNSLFNLHNSRNPNEPNDPNNNSLTNPRSYLLTLLLAFRSTGPMIIMIQRVLSWAGVLSILSLVVGAQITLKRFEKLSRTLCLTIIVVAFELLDFSLFVLFEF
jgi:hypothetical protein